MDALILGLYAFFVWLIFFKFKWLPWNTTSMVIVITIPVVALTLMILLLNVFAPSSADVRVIKPVVNVVPQVGGRVLEVPVEPNRLVKKGEVLFRIDPTPYDLAVKGLEAQLANAEASARELDEQLGGAGGGLAAARGAVQQAEARVHEVQAKLDFTLKRVEDNRELVRRGAGDRFALETAETDAKTLMAQRAACSRSRAATRCRPRPANARCASASAARWATSMRRWRRSRPSSTTPVGSSRRRPWWHRRTAMRSTCNCEPARSPPPSRSRRR
jgi:multidrug resistance efflux pump